MVLGLTGAPASGKSEVAAILRDRGAEVVDADAEARAVLDAPEVLRRASRALSADVTDARGRADRARIAALVFGPGNAAALARLERVLHPAVRRRLRGAVAAARRRRAPAVVLEVPLLFEAGADALCDVTVVVEAPRSVRRVRAAARGWTAADLAAREARMWPAARRRARADAVLRNGGSREALTRAVGRFWNRFIEGGRVQGGPGRTP